MENKQNTQNVPTLTVLEAPEHLKFNDVISTSTQTSEMLELEISNFLGSAFDDFEGCKIVDLNGDGRALKVKAYFKPCFNKVEGGAYAIKVVGEDIKPANKNNITFANVVNFVNKRANTDSKMYDLEQIAKDAFVNFITLLPNNIKREKRFNEDLGKVIEVLFPAKWDPYLEEIGQDKPGVYHENYVAVLLDLTKLVGELYGKKDPKEVKMFAGKGLPRDRYQYEVVIRFVRNITNADYILEVRRIDAKQMEYLSRKVGNANIPGSIPMTRRG